MKKSILISAYPKWVFKILNGEKAAYVCKAKPTCELPITVYMYCTQRGEKPYNGLVFDNEGKGLVNKALIPYSARGDQHHRLLNGKVVAKFTLNKVEEIDLEKDWNEEYERLTAMTKEEAQVYADTHTHIAIWYIDNLVILEEPMLINELCFEIPSKSYVKWAEKNTVGGGVIVQSVMKAPQTYSYVLVEED